MPGLGLHALNHACASLLILCRSLPRVGVCLGVHSSLQQVDWYGRGPHECYSGGQEQSNQVTNSILGRTMHVQH